MNFFKTTAAALMIAAVALTGCKEDWQDEIDGLNRRVANLEALTADLKQKVEAGAMVESVTPISGGGWRIEFTSGSPIEVSNGAGNTNVRIGANGNWYINGVDTGVQAEGKNGTDGTNGSVITIGANGNWYIDGMDTGNPSRGADGMAGTIGTTLTIGDNGNWFLNGADSGMKAAGNDGVPGAPGSVITIGANGNWYIDGKDTGKPSRGTDGTNGTNGKDGADGNDGAPGKDGANGINGKDGTTPHIGANNNWYIGATDTGIPAKGLNGEKGDKGDTGDAGANGKDGADGKDGDTMIAGIVNNDTDGTVTIIMNDAAHTEYTFRKASTAVSFAILNAGTLKIAREETGVVHFAVNPSSAYISTNIADWMLYDVSTGEPPVHFTLESIEPDGSIAGQYAATIRCNAEAETVVALKLNAGTVAAPTWISSSAFNIAMGPNIAMTTLFVTDMISFEMAGTGTATINWGDGTNPETVTLASTLTSYSHTWADDATTYNIAIYGQNITQLDCADHYYSSHTAPNLTSLDVSRCTGLTYLNIDSFGPRGQITSLDVSKNTALTYLNCSSNQLTSLDVSKNTALTYLNCSYNQLTSLDVSNNTALTVLRCDYNQLTSLDVSNNTALTELHCYNNDLTSLDVSKNTALTYLNCSYNQLTSLDVSNNTALTELNCSWMYSLRSLDVSGCTALETLDCDGSGQLTNLDVTQNTALRVLSCGDCHLTSIDVSKNTALTRLFCGNSANPTTSNKFSSLDVSKNTVLTHLECHSTELTSLDVSKNIVLSELDCGHNQLRSLDVSNNIVLYSLEIQYNDFYVSELNALFGTLHGNTITDQTKTIYIHGNPEGGMRDGSIAENKGWIVNDSNS